MRLNAFEDIYALSPVQEGMLFHGVSAPTSGLYVEQFLCALRGNLDVATFQSAWERTARRHPILRTAVAWEKRDRPLQIVYRQAALPWVVEDWRELTPEGQTARLEAHLESDRARGFDFSIAPLMRFALFRMADGAHQFIWSFHHLLLDGWSTTLVLADVEGFYGALRRGQEPASGRGAPYRAYIAWLKRQDRSRAEAFWRRTLEGAEGPTRVLFDFAESADASPESSDHREVELPESVTEAVLSFARRSQLTLNTLVLGAWGVLLARFTGSRDVLFGSTVSGRPPDLAGVDSMVGLFINTLPVRIHFAMRDEIVPWLHRLQRQFLESQTFAYVSLPDIQGWSGIERGTPLFESIVVLENYPEQGGRVDVTELDLDVSGARSAERTNYPLVLVATPGQRLGFRLAFDPHRYATSTIDRMLGYFVRLLEEVERDPDRSV